MTRPPAAAPWPAHLLHSKRDRMTTAVRIGDYDARLLSQDAGVERYEASHVLLPRRVIIETIEPGATRMAAVRLLRHAFILEALGHPGVPRVYECGQHEGRPWVVIEDVEGASLEREIAAHLLPVDEVLALVEAVASILADAHGRGVLHRDITPAVIVRTPRRGFPVVLAGWSNASTTDTELARPLGGSTRYRAPELIHELPIDERVDVYALGMIAWEALTGELPAGSDHEAPRFVPADVAQLLAEMVHDAAVMRPSAAQLVVVAKRLRTTLQAPEADVRLDDYIEAIEHGRLHPRWTPQFGLDVTVTADDDIIELTRRRPH